MSKEQQALQLVLEQKLVPLYYHDDAEVCEGVLKALYDGGIRAVEFTNRGENALDNFIALRKMTGSAMREMQLGIGTIKTAADAEMFIAAGADFIVCPVVNPDVAKLVHKAGLLWVPGCLTSTEIFTAESNGAKLVKIFPGSVVGPSYITAIRELFPGLLFMPTGGVDTTKENIKAWFDNGVCAVGMGSKLISKENMQSKDYDKITLLTKDVMSTINAISK